MSQNSNIKIYIDGSCRGNGTKESVAGIGVVAFLGIQEIFNFSYRLPYPKTNNEAEYIALDRALGLLRPYYYFLDVDLQVEIFCDSKLVVNQVNGVWKCKEPRLLILKDAVLDKLNTQFFNGERIKLTWVRREENKLADALAQKITEDKTDA